MIQKVGFAALGLKNKVMVIVGLIIAILSIVFLYNNIRYRKREIDNSTAIYHMQVLNYYRVTKNHVRYSYQLLVGRLLDEKRVIEALRSGDREELTRQTTAFLLNQKRNFFLTGINWYVPDASGALLKIAVKHRSGFPVSATPGLEGIQKKKTEYHGVFSLRDGVSFRLGLPVQVGSNTGILEAVANARQLLGGMDELLGLQDVLLVRANSLNARSLDPANNPDWLIVGDSYLWKKEAQRPHLDDIMARITIPDPGDGIEINSGGRDYIIRSHLEIGGYDGNPALKALTIQDITDLRNRIDSSVKQIVLITLGMLVVVFLILYRSFGNLLGKLGTREEQLEAANQRLEEQIIQREAVEEELKTHRDHLEELIAEGTRELEIKGQEIEENEEKLRNITSAIPDAIVMLDHDGRVLFLNPAARRIFGYSHEEALEIDFFEQVVPGSSYRNFVDFLETLPGDRNGHKETNIIEMECRRKNGAKFPAEVMATLVNIQENNHLIVLFRDITKKKEEETEKRMLLSAVEQSSVGIQMADTNGIITYVNPMFSYITGYSRGEAIGKKTSLLKSDFNPDEDYRKLWETITAGKDWQGELYNRKKNGELYWDSTLISPIKDTHGNITHFVAIKEDVTHRKNMEVELLNAKETAEAASRSKGEFLANMSHEIRTPMNAIIGMTELTLGTELNQEQREYLDIVQQASKSLLKLLNDILDFSKVDVGKLMLEPAAFSLRKTIGDTARTLAVQAHGKNLEMVYHIDPEVPDELIGDSGRLRQIIVNLIGNAIKFTEEGEVVLKVDILEDSIEGKLLIHFIVSDTGIGIPDDQMSSVFEQFSQADSSSTRKYGGTGLGLAISSRLVELMGGVIWAESPATFPHFNRCGPGSTFHFTALFQVDTHSWKQFAPANLSKLKNLKVLVVDDNETNLGFLQKMLGKKGLLPEIASSGSEALALLEKQAGQPNGTGFQLVILDFRMPEMNGGTVLEKIRTQLKLDIPVILLTSGVTVEELKAFKRHEASAHLLKPVSSTELIEQILRALGYTETEPGEAGREEVQVTVDRGAIPPQRILVAEDNAINQRLIRRLLEQEGHHVHIAKNGREAVDTYMKNAGDPVRKFSLILMDIQMPDMDGIEATHQIRVVDSDIPIIALTAHAMKGDKSRYLSEGMDAYVSKPIEKKILFDTMAQFIGEAAQDAHKPDH